MNFTESAEEKSVFDDLKVGFGSINEMAELVHLVGGETLVINEIDSLGASEISNDGFDLGDVFRVRHGSKLKVKNQKLKVMVSATHL